MGKFRDIVAEVLEYIIAAMFIRGGIVVLFFLQEEVRFLPGALVYLVGEYAVFAYGLLFLVTGLLLLYAKWFKKKRVHKWILLGMFLTCAYVLPLSLALNGLEWSQLQTVIVGVISAWLYLRWKLKTEYFNPDEFKDDIAALSPPNPA